MMTGPVLVAAFLAARPALALVHPISSSSCLRKSRLFGAATAVPVENYVSRVSTLQTLLSKHGAPGSKGCAAPNDLVPVTPLQDTPELISSLSGPPNEMSSELARLHPYLYPIAKSSSTNHYIGAYRNPFIERQQQSTGSETNMPWPIVETQLDGPGMQILAPSSETMMRRIVCECDFENRDEDSVRMYNEGLGNGLIVDSALDSPYEPGSVAKLGYGVDKYVLLRVGPFADLYERIALQHLAKGDEQSSLIAAETASSKLTGFGSTFRFYARLLQSMTHRSEESRDASRMCLRLPLPTIGLTLDDFKEVAVLGNIADESDSMDVVLDKLKALYLKIKEVESDQDDPNEGKSPEQVAIDDANRLIDLASLERKSWSSIRQELAGRFRSVGRDDMASFIDFSNS